MIAGLCCIGIAIGFCTHFLNKEYFRRIMLTGIISVFLAVLPMAIAFAGGTPMQGSLGWGLSVISGGKKTDTADQVKTGNLSVQNRSLEEIAAQLQENSANQDGGSGEEVVQNTTEAPKPSMTEKMKSVLEKIARIPEKIKNTWKMMAQRIWDFVINTPTKWPSYAILAGIACLIVLGIVFCVIRNAGYGKMLLSVGLCMGILTLLLCAGNLGLPVLMDPARCSIYYTYLLAAALTVLADGIISLLFMQGVLKICLDPISFMITVGLVVGCISQGWMKVSDFSSGYVSNGALTCLANIIKENEDKTWTIVSANDETQMGLDHGWHYETITFLRKQENLKKDTEIIIPTKNVYFFIEKIPLDYSVTYAGSGQSISKKGASQSLPNSGGISMYQGEGRWILMSRMYYWAQAFMAKYPNDMKVYYESEDFICYVMPQNMYHQYNFAIDYGYNQVQAQEDKK